MTRRISIKLKVTLWFTLLMTLLAVLVLFLIAEASNSESIKQAKKELQEVVTQNSRQVEYQEDAISIGENFLAYRGSIYCVLMTEQETILAGYAPEEDLSDLSEIPLEHQNLREVIADDDQYYVLDYQCGDHIWIRGMTPSLGALISLDTLKKIMVVTLPLLILLASAGGYLLAGHSLKPIRDIRKTAQAVADSADLSQRIPIKGTDELAQLSSTFNGMFERLEQNFEAERQFTSDASHELRTPVSIILAQCEYGLENASGEEELYECIGSIQKQGYRMSKLIESLLSFTRLEQGTEQIQNVPVNLSRLTEQVCQEQQEIPEHQITLETEIESDLYVQGDRELLRRVLVNLIRNAYRYGKEQGHIKVTLSHQTKLVWLTISDDGIGIAKEDLQKIWNRFYRADKSRSNAQGGLGLGLSMVWQIVHLHGGRVSVESTQGEGSTFTVQLRRYQN